MSLAHGGARASFFLQVERQSKRARKGPFSDFRSVDLARRTPQTAPFPLWHDGTMSCIHGLVGAVHGRCVAWCCIAPRPAKRCSGALWHLIGPVRAGNGALL